MPKTFHEIPRVRPATPVLDRAATPEQLRRLGEAELEELANELRQDLLYSVGRTGGHFGAGLGVIELTIALHYVYDTPKDRLVWDVGHQAYPHKLITGRYADFDSLRQKGGVAGYLKRCESTFDHFGAGHASTSISAALGMAMARDRLGQVGLAGSRRPPENDGLHLSAIDHSAQASAFSDKMILPNDIF